MTTVDAGQVRRVMGSLDWNFPLPFGPDGFRLDHLRSESRHRTEVLDL